MTREEYKAMMSHSRAKTSMIRYPSWLAKGDMNQVRSEVFSLVWDTLPVLYKQCRPHSKTSMPWHLKDRIHIRCNIIYLANSYPHKTRNP